MNTPIEPQSSIDLSSLTDQQRTNLLNKKMDAVLDYVRQSISEIDQWRASDLVKTYEAQAAEMKQRVNASLEELRPQIDNLPEIFESLQRDCPTYRPDDTTMEKLELVQRVLLAMVMGTSAVLTATDREFIMGRN